MSDRKVFIAVDYDGAVEDEGMTLRLEPALTNFISQFGKPVRRTVYTTQGSGWSVQKYILLELKRLGWSICNRSPVTQRWFSSKGGAEDEAHFMVRTKLVMDVWEASLSGRITDVVLFTHRRHFLPLIEGLRARNINVLLLGSLPQTHSDLIFAASLFIRLKDVPGLIAHKRPVTKSQHSSRPEASPESDFHREDGFSDDISDWLLYEGELNDEVEL